MGVWQVKKVPEKTKKDRSEELKQMGKWLRDSKISLTYWTKRIKKEK